MEDLYLIWSNEHGAWWNPNSAGYTADVGRAGRYSHSEAIAICRGRDGYRGSTQVPSEIPVRENDMLQCITD